MYVGPKKFVESDFVTRMRKKYSTTSEDGTVNLTPKAKVFCTTVGLALGTSAALALNAVVDRTILNKDDNTDNPTY
ncbi:hypothetical protein SEA_ROSAASANTEWAA_28 [Streptomyces phage RosaAsantewaa]|nr:hypothetical protein SEA_ROSAASANTEWAA_28 [Streptomyces phage RosaAsantewaa]